MKKLTGIIPNRSVIQARLLARLVEVADQVWAEVRKHAVAAILFLLLCVYVYPWQTLRIALLLGMLLVAISQIKFVVWMRKWKVKLVAADREIPSMQDLRKTFKKVEKKEELLLKKWPELCIMNGLHSNKRTPLLLDPEPTLDLDFTARIPRTGFDPDDIKAKAAKIAKGLGCQSIIVRETSVGSCEITFNWTNPIRRELALRDLKMPRRGGVVVGHTAHDTPAELPFATSKLWVGVSGSGKSNGAEAGICDLARRGVPIRLRILNPKRNELKLFKELLKQPMGTFEVRDYAESKEDCLRLLKDAAHAMDVRNGVMKGRQLTEPTIENPLDITYADELLMLPKEAYKDGSFSPMGQLAVAGRASLFSLWGSTQQFYAAEFGTLKGLFDERILFRVKTATQADMVIDEAVKRGALAHRIHKWKEKGVGYIEDEHGDVTLFRAPKVEDWHLQRLIRGLIPDPDMSTEPAKAEDKPTEQAVYFIEAQGTDLVKIGIAESPDKRLRELQTASPHKLTILGTMPGGRAQELAFHKQFAATRAHGEWFHRTPEIDALIADVIAGKHTEKGPEKQTPHPVRHARDWIDQKQIAHREAKGLEPKPVKAPAVQAPDDLLWLRPDFVAGRR